MKIEDFDYDLPPELIAQRPLKSRDASRLMIVHRAQELIEHSNFKKLPCYLDSSDCLAINTTRVFPARLKGRKVKTGGKVEVLLLRQIGKNHWKTLVKPARRLPIGSQIIFGESALIGEISKKFPGGARGIVFQYQGEFERLLERIGEVALPPYIKAVFSDSERYQTIYASGDTLYGSGSVAAPTAGFHFSAETLDAIESKGVRIATVTLSIGVDTFRPVTEAEVENHKIHSEYFRINKESAKTINKVRERGGRVVAVGTSTARVLETASQVVSGKRRKVAAKEGWTSLFIYPGYTFQIVDVLISNFHLPRSTPILMVSAFGKKNLIKKAYQEAVKKRYRFLSFGDCMLLKE